MLGGMFMPKNSDAIGILFLLLLLNKKIDLSHDLHRITEILNMVQKIGPMMSMLDSLQPPNYDDYEEENRNAIF